MSVEYPSRLLPGETVKHLEELDGIRGIAILAVLASHAVDLIGIVPGDGHGAIWPMVVRRIFIPGWGGVDLFFTLSGYLITGILLRARERTGYFKSFYARRALRIFPIYYLILVVTLLVSHLLPGVASVVPQRPVEIASFFFYVQNWPVFWKSWAGLTSMWGAYWSLAVEEQFYLVWPTVVRWLRSGTLLGLCIIGFTVGAPERLLMIRHVGMNFGMMQWPFSRLDGLFLGAALAFYRERFGRAFPLRWAGVLFAVGASMWIWIIVLHTRELDGWGGRIWTEGVTAFALMSGGLVAASHYRTPLLQRVLTVRPLLVAGKYSYGIYVYHLAIFLAARALWPQVVAPRLGPGLHPAATFAFLMTAILAAFGVAALSFRYIETPFLRLKRLFPSPAAPV